MGPAQTFDDVGNIGPQTADRGIGVDQADVGERVGIAAEQLSTAHWFDQRGTQAALDRRPEVSPAEGFAGLGARRTAEARISC